MSAVCCGCCASMVIRSAPAITGAPPLSSPPCRRRWRAAPLRWLECETVITQSPVSGDRQFAAAGRDLADGEQGAPRFGGVADGSGTDRAPTSTAATRIAAELSPHLAGLSRRIARIARRLATESGAHACLRALPFLDLHDRRVRYSGPFTSPVAGRSDRCEC